MDVGTLEVLLALRDSLTPALRVAETSVGKFRSAVNLANQTTFGLSKTLDGMAMGIGMKVWDTLARQPMEAVRAFSEAERASNELARALASQGNMAKGTMESLLDYASAVQDTTAFEDDAVTAAQALGATFGMNEETLKRATDAALDYSSSTGKDLQNAMQDIGKAYQGNTGVLERYIGKVTEGVAEEKKFEVAVAALEARFGGSAKLAAQTMTGQLEQLKNMYGDVQEALGELLVTMASIGPGIDSSKGALKWLADFIGKDLVGMIELGRAAMSTFLQTWTGVLLAAMNAADAAGLDKLAVGFDFEKMRSGLQAMNAEFAVEARISAEAANRAFLGTGSRVTPKNLRPPPTGGGDGGDTLKQLEAAEAKMREIAQQAEEGLLAIALDRDQEAMADWQANMVAMQGELALFDEAFPSTEAAQEWADNTATMADEIERMGEAGQDLAPDLEAIGPSIEDAIPPAVTWQESLARTQATVSGIGDSFGSLSGLLSQFGAEGLAQIAGGLSDVSSGVSSAMGAFSAFSSGDIIGGIQGAISAVGSLASGLETLFGQTDAERIGEMLGEEISDALAETIMESADQFGLALEDAILLHITDIAEETGDSMASMADDVGNLLAGLADGTLPLQEGFDELGEAMAALGEEAALGIEGATEAMVGLTAAMMEGIASGALPLMTGVEQIGQAFSDLEEQAEAGLGTAQQGMLALIQQARTLGLEIPEIAAAIQESLGSALEGMAGFFAVEGGITLSAEHAAQLFGAHFLAALGEMDPAAALEALAPVWEQLGDQIGALLPAEMVGFMGLTGDQFGPVLQQIGMLTQMTAGLGDSAYLTTGSFVAMQAGALAAYQGLIDGGASGDAALMATRGLLAEIVAQADAYGVALDPATQALVDQSAAMGAFPVDPLMQLVDLVGALVTGFGFALPGALGATTTTFQGMADQSDLAMQGMSQGWRGSLGDMVDAAAETSVSVVDQFTAAGQAAVEIGDWVGISWTGSIAEIPVHLADALPGIDESFRMLEDVAVTHASAAAQACGNIAGNLGQIPGAVATANAALGTLVGPGAGAGTPGGTPGTPRPAPSYQHGGFVPAGVVQQATLHGGSHGEFVVPGEQLAGLARPTVTINLGGITVSGGANADPAAMGVAIAQKLREHLVPPLEAAIGDIAKRVGG